MSASRGAHVQGALLVLLLLAAMVLSLCSCSYGLYQDYEADELLAVRHNTETDCTLLVYRTPVGEMRHVFRRHGVFELGLRYTLDGSVLLKERGRQERPVDGVEASRVTRYINGLLGIEPDIDGRRVPALVPEGYQLSVLSALDAPPIAATLDEVRRWHVRRVESLSGGHQQQMANILGVSEFLLIAWSQAWTITTSN